MLENKKKTKRAESKKGTRKTINFTLLAPEAERVLLAGDFNAWNTHTSIKKRHQGKMED